jgi:hypothetical protein
MKIGHGSKRPHGDRFVPTPAISESRCAFGSSVASMNDQAPMNDQYVGSTKRAMLLE